MIAFVDADREDAAALDAMARDAWERAYRDRFTRDDVAAYCNLNFGPAGLVAAIGEPEVRFRLARTDRAIVAYAKLKPLAMPVPDPEGGALELERLYVKPSRQGRGIARALLDWAIGEAEARAVPLYLAVFDFNLRAQAIYRRRGFVEIGAMVVPVGARQERDLIWRLTAAAPQRRNII